MSDNSTTAGDSLELSYEIRNYQGTVALIYKIMELLILAISLLKEIRGSRISQKHKERIDSLVKRAETVSFNVDI